MMTNEEYAKAIRAKGEKIMTNTEINNLKPGDAVKVQADDDPELETAMIVKVSGRKFLVFGEDNSLPLHRQGFLMWLGAAEIYSLVEAHSNRPQQSMTIHGFEMEVVKDLA